MKITLLGLISILFISFQSTAADLYWVQGSGNWSDTTNHWSFTSGGAPGATLPRAGDNVFFDLGSGLLSLAVTITVDTSIVANDLDFSGIINIFTMNGVVPYDHTIHGSITGNLTGINFTGTWGEIHLDAPLTGETVNSGATIWAQDFRILGESISFTDNFDIATNDIYIDSGGVDLNGNTLTCGALYSNSLANRTISMNGSVINVSKGVWDIDGTNLTANFANSEIILGNTAGSAQFSGGNQNYGILRTITATTTQYFNNNSFTIFEVAPSSSLQINNGDNLSSDSLIISGTCGNPFVLTTIGTGANGSVTKTGFNTFNSSNLETNNVDALGTAFYNISLSNVISGSGWILSPATFYWINDSGNWTDPNQWSLSDGGAPSGCLPSQVDSVYFNANSFSTTGQTVTVNDTAFFGYMDWSTMTGNQTLLLDSNIYAYGNIHLHNNLNVARGQISSSFRIKNNTSLTSNNAFIDCNFAVEMGLNTYNFELTDDFITTDSANVLLFNGNFITNNNNVATGSLISINDPFSGGDLRSISLGASSITLWKEFNSMGDTSLVINPGTSSLFIGDTMGYRNNLITEGNNFNNVTLDFPLNSSNQNISGDNSFNKLKVVEGSHIYLQAGSTQTVADSLIMKGNCLDSIHLSTLDTTNFNPAFINKTGSNTNVIAECLNVSGINNTGLMLTTYFSTDINANTNWTFNTSPPVSASFTADGPFCNGDTVQFTNNSTSFSGNTNDITSYWYYNDGSTGYYLNPPTDSTFINYEIDTLQHVFNGSGQFSVVLMAEYTNFCTDSDTVMVDIVLPNISLLASNMDSVICPGTAVSFETFTTVPGTQFEFFYNGVSQNTPSVNDTLYNLYPVNDQDTVSVLAYEDGCVSEIEPFYTYRVYDSPMFSWSNTSTGEVICENDLVNFTATSPDSLQSFRFLLNGSSVTGIQDSLATYSTNSLNHNDIMSVVVIDSNACKDTSSVVFTVNALPLATLSESTGGTVICENELVTFTGAGANQYEFYVNGVSQQGPSTNNIYSTSTLTSTDTVTVTGISPEGCSKEAPEEFVYIVNPAPVNTLTSSDPDNTICSGENVVFTSSGSAIYEFFINGISVQGPSTNNTFSTNTLANNDLVSVIGTTSGCSGNEPSILMSVLTSPTTALANDDDGDNKICSGETVVFTATGANNYEFFVDGVSQGASSPTNTFTTSSLLNGQTISVIGESNTCTVSASNTFTVLTKPNVNLISNNSTNVICDGDPITFTAANASQYEFFVNNISVQGPANNALLVDPAFNIGVNSILVIGAANNGCTDSSSIITIQVNQIPTINVVSSDADNTICTGESVTFTASGGDNYQFVLDGTPQTSMTNSNTFTTTSLTNGQTLIVDGALSGCPNSSNAITTTVNPLPNVVLTSTDANNIFCSDELVTFTAAGATNYEFVVDGVSQGGSSPANTINSSGFTPGTFVVEVIGESLNCYNNTSTSVTVNPLPTISLVSSDANNSICENEAVTYSASGGLLYEFFINGVSQGSPSTISTFTTSTLIDNDSVSVEGSSSSGCKSDDALPNIQVLPTPVVSLTSSDFDQQICLGDTVVFTGAGASTYEFFINGISQGVPSPSATFEATNLSNGASITVQGYDSGCSSSSSALVFQVFGSPLVNLINYEDTVLCVDEVTNLEANGADNYQFFVNSNPVGTLSPTSTFINLLNDGDTVSVEGETNGCKNISNDTFIFSVFNYPTITTTTSAPGNEICLNDTVYFTANGAQSYSFEVNGNLIETNITGLHNISSLTDGDNLTITGYNAHCASTPTAFLFTVHEMNLGLEVAPSNLICKGDNVTFTGSGADEYEFFLNTVSIGAMSAVNTYSSNTFSHHDEISFTAQNLTTGCVQKFEGSIIMNVMNNPVITPLSNLEFCEGDSVTLTSNIGYGNQWYLNGNPIAGAVDTFIVADTSGTYTLEATMGGDGDLWSVGQNASGMFGNGSNFNSAIPVFAETSLNFTELSSGFNFILGITDNGDLYSWGENSSGELGNGTFTASSSPIPVGNLSNIKTVGTSSRSSMAVTNSNEVYVWGNNNHGQLGTGNTAVINFPFLNASLTDVDTVAGGRDHFILLKTDGTVLAVGNNDYGQLGNNSLIGSQTAITIPGLSNIVSIGAGEYTSYAIDNTGNLYVWGNNGSGQLGLGDLNGRLNPTLSDLRDVVSVQGGANHTVFLTDDREVYTSGGNTFGQLGNNTLVPTVSPSKINISQVDMISAGQYTTLMKRKDNSVFGCGNNSEDQLIDQGTVLVSTPQHLSSLEGVTFIEASKNSSHFIFGKENTCTSPVIVTEFLPAPDVVINSAADTLSTSVTGVSYQWYFNTNPISGANQQDLVASSSGIYHVEVFFANGCSSISNDFVHSMSSLEEFSAIEFTIYPNPATQIVNIDFGQNIEIENIMAVDNIGKVVFSSGFTKTQKMISLNTENFENGVYHIEIKTSNKRVFGKFVVTH